MAISAPSTPSSSDPRQALLDAAIQALSRAAPSAVSGRELAGLAGVSYGQIHRLFGSKHDLLRAALAHLIDGFGADAFPEGAIVPTPGILSRHRPLVRALANVLIDGAPMQLRGVSLPAVGRYRYGMARLRPDLDQDHRDTIVALSLSLQLGIELHGPVLIAASGLGSDFAFRSSTVLLVEQLQAGLGPFGGPAPQRRKLVSHGPRHTGIKDDVGRDAVRQKLVRAACQMLEDRGPASISGRGLADRAGVNYGLVYQYFGSVNDVLTCAYDQVRRDFYEVERQGQSPPDFFSVGTHPGYVRAITNMFLDDGLVSASYFPVLQTLIARHERNHGAMPDRLRFIHAASVSTQLAWALMRPLLDDGLDQNVSDIEALAAGYLAKLLRSETRYAIRNKSK